MSSAPKRKRVTALPARPPWPRLSLVQHRGGTLRSKGGKSRRTELSCCHTCGSPVVARLAQATPASSEEAASGKQEEQRATETEQECHDCATNIPRRVLPHVTSFNDVVDAIRRAQRVLVLCGAGISVSCGLPDFRSKNGLYSIVASMGLPLPQPECLFDMDYFTADPGPFFAVAKDLLPGQLQPSPAHMFIRALQDHNKLLRCYTQNIDALEDVAGVTKVVPCHGSFATATCQRCHRQQPGAAIRKAVLSGLVPRCGFIETTAAPAANAAGAPSQVGAGARGGGSNAEDEGPPGLPKRRRSNRSRQKPVKFSQSHPAPSDTKFEEVPAEACGGVMKPDIIFFGQPLGNTVAAALNADRKKADCLLVMGTSMQVAPMSRVGGLVRRDIPQVLINKQHVALKPSVAQGFDVELLGNADAVVQALVHALGWKMPQPPGVRCPPDTPLPAKSVSDTSPPPPTSSLTGHVAPGHPRVWLFEGADWSPQAMLRTSASPPAVCSSRYAEVLQPGELVCDGCGCEVVGEFFKCADCMWLEVCAACFVRVAGEENKAGASAGGARRCLPGASGRSLSVPKWAEDHASHVFHLCVVQPRK